MSGHLLSFNKCSPEFCTSVFLNWFLKSRVPIFLCTSISVVVKVGQGRGRGPEPSRPRPRTQICVLEDPRGQGSPRGLHHCLLCYCNTYRQTVHVIFCLIIFFILCSQMFCRCLIYYCFTFQFDYL